MINIYTGVGLVVHTDKTILSEWPILFEEYGHPDFTKKESLWRSAIC